MMNAEVNSAPNLPAIQSPETSTSASIATPSPPHMPASALLSLSPPSTLRRSSSQSYLPDQPPGSHAPRRSRILRQSSISSASSSDADGPIEARYGRNVDDDNDDDKDGGLSVLSLSVTPGKKMSGLGNAAYNGGPSRRGGRHSVAADITGTGPLTLRDQEQVRNFGLGRDYSSAERA